MRWKIPKPRFRMATLLVLIALIGIGLGIWREYHSPKWVWHRAIHGDDLTLRGQVWYRTHLGQIDGMSPEETEATLAAALRDVHAHVRLEALRSLAWRHRNSTSVIPMFLPLLRDEDYQVRRMAASDIGYAVPQGGEGRDLAVPALLPLVDDPLPIVRQDAIEALGTIANRCERAKDPLMAVLRRKLDDPDENIRIITARAMTWSGAGDEAVPLLKAHVLAHYRPDGKSGSAAIDTAFNALARIAVRSDDVVRFLLLHVYGKGQDPQNQYFNALTLASGYEKEGHDRVTRLALEALEGNDFTLKFGAATLLMAIGEGAPTIPTWAEIIRTHEGPEVRFRAVWQMRNLGYANIEPSEMMSVIEALRGATKDPDPAVRRDAAEGLGMLEKRAKHSSVTDRSTP